MKKKLLLVLMLVGNTVVFADTSVMADFEELYKLGQDSLSELISLQEYFTRRDKIRNRVRPVVEREFVKLADGELSPLARGLLENLETVDASFCIGVLNTQLKTYTVDVQTKVFEKVFGAVPDSQRGRIILAFVTNLPKEVFTGKDIQQWLVDAINGGLPGGAFYFILTDGNARMVEKTAVASMRQFSKANIRGHNLFPLMSIIFLASRGDDEALKFLDSSLDQMDFDSIEIITAAAMSGNEQLIKKVLNIVVTDKRVRINGFDCIPQKTSFAHMAATACSLTIEGFPSVRRLVTYDDALAENVRQWIEANSAYSVRLEDPRVFLGPEGFNSVISEMYSAMEKK